MPTGKTEIVADTIFIVLVDECVTIALDDSVLSLLDMDARVDYEHHNFRASELPSARQVSGWVRRTLPTHRPNGSRTLHAHLPPFNTRASVSHHTPH